MGWLLLALLLLVDFFPLRSWSLLIGGVLPGLVDPGPGGSLLVFLLVDFVPVCGWSLSVRRAAWFMESAGVAPYWLILFLFVFCRCLIGA